MWIRGPISMAFLRVFPCTPTERVYLGSFLTLMMMLRILARRVVFACICVYLRCFVLFYAVASKLQGLASITGVYVRVTVSISSSLSIENTVSVG